jgi:methionyl-tRNA formyltransferase
MNVKKHKIAFFGSDEIALPFLGGLHEAGFEVSAALTQPDRRSGRGRKLQPNAIKQWAIESGVPCRDPQKPSNEDKEWLKSIGIELIIVMAYGHILKLDLLEVASLGCFNLHASVLPSYRGASPIETALASGEKETGVTLMRIVPQMDAGPIVDIERVLIAEDDTGPTLREKIGLSCVPLIGRNLNALLTGDFAEKPQNESQATYCRKLTKEDGLIDFRVSAQSLVHRIQAFRSWPGVSFRFGDLRIKVGKSSVADLSLLPGEVSCDGSGHLSIGTGRDALVVHELQKPGGKMLATQDFLRGFAIPDGTILESEFMPDLLVSGKSNSKA